MAAASPHSVHPTIDVGQLEKELGGVGGAVVGLADVSVVACCRLMVRFRVRRTKIKEMDVCLNFPHDYPKDLILMEVKSKNLPEKFTESVVLALEQEKAKFINKPQILPALRFALDFLDANTLCVCVQEICDLKRLIASYEDAENSEDSLKVRQKASAVFLRVGSRGFFVDVRFGIPDDYPDTQIDVELRDSNFPDLFRSFFFHQAKELARRAVQPPLLRRKKGQKGPIRPPADFKPQPSLHSVGAFLIEAAKRYPGEPCAICERLCFAADPSDVEEEFEAAAHVERVYCGHIFHFACIDVYMKTPPFRGGKPCPKCSSVIYHDKWKDSERTREDRWAHKEAKQREMEEVEDFLS